MKNLIFNAVCKTRYLALLVLLIFTCGNIWGTDVSFTIPKISSYTSYTINGVSWTVAGTGGALGQNVDGTKGAQIGTAKNPATALSFSTSGISGTITSITVNTSGASSVSATVAVSVGSTSFKSNGNTTKSISATATNYTFTGSASGTITISWSQSSSKALYVKTISVTYSSGTSVTLSKAATTNGSFTLSPASSVTTTSSAGVVTVSCSPADGYATSSVSATNPATNPSAITYGGSGNSRTVTYATGANGSSTISVTFACVTPTISSDLSTTQVNYALNASAAALSISASANNATLSYAWEKSANGTSGWTSVGSNSSSYTPPTDVAGDLYYRCTVTNEASGCSTTAVSQVAHIHVNAGSTWKFKYSGDDYDPHIMTEAAGVASYSLSLAADTRYEFGFDDNGSAFYKNQGTIITTTDGWVFNTSDNNCKIHTGPAGTYTFAINTTTKAVTVTYPTVTHPNDHYVYFKNTNVWGTVYGYLANSGNDNKAAAWPGSVMQPTTTICGETYHYAALNAMSGTYNTIIFNNGNSGYGNQTSDLSTTGSLGKYNANQDANWHQFKYTISYAAGTGGSGSMSSHANLCPGSNQALSSNTFTRDHYHFTGWVASADVTINSATVTAGTLITGTPTLQNVQSDITLTAQWEVNSNTLTWNWGGGSTSSTSYTLYPATSGLVNYNAAITKPANNTMSKTGYNFSSWSSNATTMPDEPLTITANWTAKTTAITLNKNNSDASGSTAGSASWTYGQTTKNSLTAATRTGYNVDGYYTAASSGTKILNADGSLAGNSITVDAVVYTSGGKWAYDGTSLTLYAHWTLKTTTVSFNQNSGTGGQTTTKTATYSQAMPTPITTPTRAGYTFTGYFENSGGTGTKYYNADGSSATNWNKENATWTLYAGWTAKEDTYKTALHTGASGWTTYASGVTKSGAGYTIPAPISVTKGATSSCEDTHYHFAGWVADEYKGSPSGHIIAASGTTDATGATYWAVWEKEKAGSAGAAVNTVLFSENWTGVENNTTPSSPSESGSEVYNDATVTYNWEDGGTTTQTYTSGGPNSNENILISKSNGSWTASGIPVGGAATITYTYAKSGSGVLAVSTTTANVTVGGSSSGSTITISGNVSTFDLKFENTATGNNNLRLDDIVVKVATQGVSYEDPKAVCEACVATPSISGVSLMGTAFTTTSVPVQATGASAGVNCSLAEYGFYWGGSADPTTNETASDNLSTGTFSATLTGPFTIGTTYHYRAFGTNEADNTGYSSDASFTLQNVSFNMHSHGGDAPATQVVPRGLKATAPSTPSETGYTFDGWWDNSSYTGSAWNFGTNTVGSGNVTLHAKWTEKPKYTITLNAGNGTVTADGWTAGESPTWSKTQANGDEEITLPSASCNCAGWEFQGWAASSVDQAGAPTMTSSGASVLPASNTTYYAVYRQNTPSGDNYTKITTTGELTTGYYVITGLWNGTTPYAMKGELYNEGVSLAETSQTVSTNVATQSNAAFVWQILNFGSYVAFKNKDTGKFLAIVDGKFALQDDGQKFTYSVTSGAWTFTSPSGKQIIYASRFNVADAQDKAIHLFRQNPNLSGNYKTVPSCSDYTITGVANPAAGGSVQLTATAAKNGDKVWACYTADPEYDFTDWTISGTGVSPTSATTQFVAITVGSGNVTATANFAAKVMYDITWKAHGEALTGVALGSASVRVEDGHNITALPPVPTSCETGDGKSDQFIGWVVDDQNWSGKTNDLTGITIYKKASEFPAVDDDVTYHAVWAAIDETTNEWVKVTSVDDLNDGETVAFISAGEAYYLPNAASASGSAPSLGTVTKTSGDINFVNAMKFTAIYNSTYGGFTFESVSAAGKYLWAYNDNKGIYISATDESKTNASNIWYLEDFDEANSASTGYGIGMYATTGSGNYRYLTTYGTTDWRSYKSTSVGTGTPVNILANIYRYAAGHKNYMTRCCIAPTITINGTGKTVTDGKISFPVLREDLGGASSSTWAELPITISSNSTGAITIITGTGGDASKSVKSLTGWQNRSTDGGSWAGTSHATFTNPSSGNYLFSVKTTTGYTGQGTYRIGITQAADATYCEATVYMWIDVTLRDKFIDVVNGNAEINKDGHGAQLKTPAESDMDADLNDDCNSTTRRLIGWIKETDLQTMYGSPGETGYLEDAASYNASKVVAPYADFTTSGCTWYAVWGVDNTPEP